MRIDDGGLPNHKNGTHVLLQAWLDVPDDSEARGVASEVELLKLEGSQQRRRQDPVAHVAS